MNNNEVKGKLLKFKKLLRDWLEEGKYNRTEINKLLPFVRRVADELKVNKVISISAPLALGGYHVADMNVLDAMRNAPYDLEEDAGFIVVDMIDEMIGILDIQDDDEIDLSVFGNKSVMTNNMTKRVFIVHGHDTSIRNEVELFVRSIGYEPVILCKQPDMGSTIIEKIERESSTISYAIIIYTSCDLGKANTEIELKPRARQNVIFEHGYMYAQLGRTRVCAILEEGVEQPSDLQGVVYKKIDKEGNWRYAIAKEMKAVGLEVDLNKIP